MDNVIFKNARIIDGMGNPWFKGSVAEVVWGSSAMCVCRAPGKHSYLGGVFSISNIGTFQALA